MFRYERPQKGRYRQFHHVGVECLGINDPYADVECIALGVEILTQLDINARLEINTIGDLSSRLAYRQALIDYLTPYEKDLSPDSQLRLQRNPLRILDSKDPTDRQILLTAPLFDTYLTSEAQIFYEKVRQGLENLEIPTQHNPRLVRGLDYYCHTVFEIVHDGLGAQNTLLAGGRYDGLVEQMGGPAVPGLGWALGVERVVSCLQKTCAANPPFAMIYVSEHEMMPALQLAIKLRRQGHQVELCYSSTMAKRFKQADRLKAKLALILGPEELANNEINIKNLATGKQERVNLDQLNIFLAQH
jgi:histidyl-tRNA synthetase